MLALWYAPFCLLVTSLAAASSEEGPLHRDGWGAVISKMGLATLGPASLVSKSFCLLAAPVLMARYGMGTAGGSGPNYTKLVYAHGRFVQDAKEGRTATEAAVFLEESLDYRLIRSILIAEFGHCFAYDDGFLPYFEPQMSFAEVFYDAHKISVLPYVLDHLVKGEDWLYCVRGLAKRKRWDLFGQVKFMEITETRFQHLLSLALPASVIKTAAEAFQREEPGSELANVLTFAGFGQQQEVLLPPAVKLPLFTLQHIIESDLSIPDGITFSDGLHGSSISFWMYVLSSEAERAAQLLDIVLRRGDEDARLLVFAFHGPVTFDHLDGPKKDVYQAMLIRFNSDGRFGGAIRENSKSMLKGLSVIGYHTTDAFMDCKQYEEAAQLYLASGTEAYFQTLADQMCLIGDIAALPLFVKCLEGIDKIECLLKNMIRAKVNDGFTFAVWSALRQGRGSSMDVACCSPSVGTLKSLVFEQGISVVNVESLLDMQEDNRDYTGYYTSQLSSLCTVMHWGASEEGIAYFLAQSDDGHGLASSRILEVLLSGKYSDELCVALFKRAAPVTIHVKQLLSLYRPDLAEKLGL